MTNEDEKLKIRFDPHFYESLDEIAIKEGWDEEQKILFIKEIEDTFTSLTPEQLKSQSVEVTQEYE